MVQVEFSEKPIHIRTCFSLHSRSYRTSTLDLPRYPQHTQPELLKVSSPSIDGLLAMVSRSTRGTPKFPQGPVWPGPRVSPLYVQLHCSAFFSSGVLPPSFPSQGLHVHSVQNLEPSSPFFDPATQCSSFLSQHQHCFPHRSFVWPPTPGQVILLHKLIAYFCTSIHICHNNYF